MSRKGTIIRANPIGDCVCGQFIAFDESTGAVAHSIPMCKAFEVMNQRG